MPFDGSVNVRLLISFHGDRYSLAKQNQIEAIGEKIILHKCRCRCWTLNNNSDTQLRQLRDETQIKREPSRGNYPRKYYYYHSSCESVVVSQLGSKNNQYKLFKKTKNNDGKIRSQRTSCREISEIFLWENILIKISRSLYIYNVGQSFVFVFLTDFISIAIFWTTIIRLYFTAIDGYEAGREKKRRPRGRTLHLGLFY